MGKRLSEKEYTDMALELEHDNYGLTGEPTYPPEVTLRRGRPTRDSGLRGGALIRSVRLAQPMAGRLNAQAKAEKVSQSEIMRRALDEYLARH
jgi:hypothetical protein